MPRYDVFLSHASADKPAVEQLARKLREAGIEPFFDQWFLVAGELWQEGLEEAVRQSATCAVFFGPVSKGGAWRNQETQLALARAAQDATFRVIPILLPQSKAEDVPGFLSLRTWVDFRNDLDDAGALARLIASIRREAPGDGGGGVEKPLLPYRCMAPPREPFIQRSEYAKVRDALLAGSTVGITTAIHGAGGFGKTALAVELCYDPVVRERYPDGVLWVQMRDNLNDDGRLKEVRDVLRRWTKQEPPAFETVAKAGQHLVELLNGKQVLLVVDDTWHSGDVSPFQGLDPTAALLITTRDSRTLPRETVSIHVDSMEIPEAVRLLGAGLPGGAEAELKALAARLGEWPLLLKLVNRQVAEWVGRGFDPGEAIRRAENALKAKGLTYFEPKDAKDRSQAAALTLEVSLERLSKEEQERFAQLAIFPEDANVPFSVLEKLWQLDSFDAEELSSRLYALSLLRDFDVRAGTIRLHDVIRTYLLKRGESQLAEWHRRLLDAHRPANGRWPDLPRDESYLWNHLFHHLIGAGESDGRNLLLDFQYLASKLVATDINALLADYSFFVENDQELRLVRDALRLSAHVLTRNPFELRGQLWGRLLDRQETGIRNLLQGGQDPGACWLRPRKASFTRPGGALIRTIDHPGGTPYALAVLADGRVVSGADDTSLRVWNLESNQDPKVLRGHSDWINAVVALDSRRVVSGSGDGTLRVWDVETGEALKTLQGHSDSVRALAVLDSHRVVSSSNDKTLRVWDVETGQALKILTGHSSWVVAVAVLDGQRVLSASDDGTLRVWDLESGATLQTLQAGFDSVRAVAALDSRRVATGSSKGTLRVWDVESGQAVRVLEGNSFQVTTMSALDGRRVVFGSNDGSLRVWEVEGAEALRVFEGHADWICAVAVLDSRRVISGSADETLRIWDVESGQALEVSGGHSGGVFALAALDDSRVVSGSADKMLRVWDLESGQSLQTLQGHSGWIRAVAALDGDRVVSASADGTLRVWDLERGEVLQVLAGHTDWVQGVAVLEGDQVVSSSADQTLRVWDIATGQALHILKGHSDEVYTVAALDRSRVVSGSADGTLRVWDVESGQTLLVLQGHSEWVNSVAVLDRRRVVSGSLDQTLRVWDIENNQVLRVLTGHSDSVNAVAVLDSSRVVSGSSDRTLRIWDADQGELKCQLTLDAPVTAVAVVFSIRTIVAGDSADNVHFFDLVEPS